MRAVASYCRGRDICIIAAGASWGQAEDLGVALALAALTGGAVFDPAALACCVRESEAARHLKSLGFQADVDFIADSAQYAVVPVYDGKEIRNVEPRLVKNAHTALRFILSHCGVRNKYASFLRLRAPCLRNFLRSAGLEAVITAP